jgi:5-methylcytosine-specific restriction enzyme B
MNTVWKIAPGEQACVWDECRDDKCITINWLNRKNCLDFDDKKEIRQALIKAKEGKGGGGAPSIWQFCRDVQQGHVVVANEGLSRVVGIGLVRSGYLPPGDRRNLEFSFRLFARGTR